MVSLHLSHLPIASPWRIWLLMSPYWVTHWLYGLSNSIFFPFCIHWFSCFYELILCKKAVFCGVS